MRSVRAGLTLAVAGALVLGLGCAEETTSSPPIDDASVVDAVSQLEELLSGECDGTLRYTPTVTRVHVPFDEPPTYTDNPPATGDHFPIWTKWGSFDEAIPREYWVHSLEHGAVVIGYRCEDDCETLRGDLEAVAAQVPPDPLCAEEEADNRFVITPDPLLPEDVRVAVVAWEWAYTANCVVTQDILTFIEARYAQGPEDFCAPGGYPSETNELGDLGEAHGG